MPRLVVSSHGAVVALDAPADVLAEVGPLLAPATRTGGPDSAGSDGAGPAVDEIVRVADGTVTSDSGGRLPADDHRELVRIAASQVHLCIAVHGRTGLFVHAGAVVWRGMGIVVPGRSMTGKSTLTRALVEAGAGYCSDEYAVLDADGLLHPYPKPLSIRVTDGPNLAVTPERVGDVAGAPVRVGLVVVTQHRPGARWHPETSGPARAALALVDNTVVARRDPVRTLDVATATAAGSRCLHGDRGDAAATADQILRFVEALV